MPGVTVEPTVMFIVEVPLPPVMDDGEKPKVTPLGCPLADKLTVELKPPVGVTVMVELPPLPWAMETELGEAERV